MDMQTTSRNLLAAVATVAMLAAGVLPGSALAAGKRTVKDAKFDNVKVSRNGRIDITKVTASRDGAETKFAIAMRAKLKPARSKERPGIFINTRGNRRKGNRLPREIKMHPRTAPRAPGPNVFIRVAAPKVPPSWEPYLAMAA